MVTELLPYPRVSLVIFGYRHERYIAEAVQSALVQTGPPIEILVSDDASPDGTFEVMKEATANYRGPHKVILNRNSANLGLADHINRAWQLCRGDFVIMQGGDDVSVPNRVEKLVSRWLDKQPVVDLVCSYYEEMTFDGKPTGFIQKNTVFVPNTTDHILEWRCGATGACAGYSRRLHEAYGPLDNKVVAEDWVYSFRAWIESGIGLVEEPLVKHRRHEGSISAIHKNVKSLKDRGSRRSLRREGAEGQLAIAREWLRAAQRSPAKLSRVEPAALEKLVKLRELELSAVEATPLQAVKIIAASMAIGGGFRHNAKLFVRHVLKRH